MALIKCPECGKKFSDQADACPRCGCPTSKILEVQKIKEAEKVNNEEGSKSTRRTKAKKKLTKVSNKKKWGIIGACVVAALCVVGIVSATRTRLYIGDWTQRNYADGIGQYDHGVATSNTKKPFIAEFQDSDGYRKLVFMNEGKGTLERYHSDSDSFPPKYSASGYYKGGQTCSTSDVKVSAKPFAYEKSIFNEGLIDASTDLTFKSDIQSTGLLMVDIHNKMTEEYSNNTPVVLVNGKGSWREYDSKYNWDKKKPDYGYVPRYFIPSKPLDPGDYKVRKEMDVDSKHIEGEMRYDGTETLEFPHLKDGLILYKITQVSGGAERDKGRVSYDCGFLKNHSCEVYATDIVYFTDFDDDISKINDMTTPKFEIEPIGYIPEKH